MLLEVVEGGLILLKEVGRWFDVVEGGWKVV